MCRVYVWEREKQHIFSIPREMILVISLSTHQCFSRVERKVGGVPLSVPSLSSLPLGEQVKGGEGKGRKVLISTRLPFPLPPLSLPFTMGRIG